MLPLTATGKASPTSYSSYKSLMIPAVYRAKEYGFRLYEISLG